MRFESVRPELDHELAEASQIAERIDASAVPIAPTETKGVVPDPLDFSKLQVSRFVELETATMTLAARTGAVAAQNPVWNRVLRSICPGQGQDGSPVGSLDALRGYPRIHQDAAWIR